MTMSDEAIGLECHTDGLECMNEAMGSHCWLRSLFPSLPRQPPSHTAEQFPKAFSLISDCFPNPEAARVSSFFQPKSQTKLSSQSCWSLPPGTYEPLRAQSQLQGRVCGLPGAM